MTVLERWEREDHNSSGQRLLLMPLSRWLREAQTDRGLSASDAQSQWDQKQKQHEMGKLDEKQWRMEGKTLWLAMPHEEYVDIGQSDVNLGFVRDSSQALLRFHASSQHSKNEAAGEWDRGSARLHREAGHAGFQEEAREVWCER